MISCLLTVFRVVAGGSGWRMTGPYDAAITGGVLRISNAVTSGSFGDQLFSPELATGATENGAVTTFKAAFNLKPVALQPGLRVTVSPDNGAGARGGFLAIEHRTDGLAIQVWGSYFDEAGELEWKIEDLATGLDPRKPRRIQMTLDKNPDTATNTNNDVFTVHLTGKPAATTTFEAYYDAVNAAESETDTLLFRISASEVMPAVPALLGKGLLIDDLSMNVS